MYKVFKNLSMGSLSNLDRDSTKIPKFRIQCNFSFQRKEVWSSKQVRFDKMDISFQNTALLQLRLFVKVSKICPKIFGNITKNFEASWFKNKI